MKLEIFKMAFESLLANKTRSFLSMLGIIIGVSTVIAVFAIGEGAKKAVDEQFAGLSAKSIIVMQMGRSSSASSKLSIDDIDVIEEESKYIEASTGIIQGTGGISFGAEEITDTIVGAGPDFFTISKMDLSSGRFYADDESKERIAILGSGVYENLYSDGEDALGTTITVNGKKLEVIGVFKETGGNLARLSKDEAVYIPYDLAKNTVLGSSGGQVMLTLESNSVDNVSLAVEEVTNILRDEHNLSVGQEDDFRLFDAGSMVSAAQDSATLMSTILTLVAAITLLVSGIGIMNVMFVTVAERTKEIGIAKAIGGKQADILTQFLMESVILSALGGITGVVIGQITIPIISNLNIMAMSSSLMGPILGFSFSALVGITFGFYPALKASRLDPVDALRSE